jgi:preprotein translocase subunit SecF
MEWIRPDTNIDFVGQRNKAFLLSAVVILVGLVAFVVRGGLNLGVDFAGGTLVQVKFSKPVNADEIRKALDDLISSCTIQQVGSVKDNEFLIRTEAISTELQSYARKVEEELTKAFGGEDVSVGRVEMVGPKVGQDLRQKALFAIFYSLLFMVIYISGRFEFKWGASGILVIAMLIGVYLLEAIGIAVSYLIVGALLVTLALCWLLKLPYALGAILSLMHDVLVTVGFFVLFDKEFTLEVLAALLTLVGFSINDTIVIYDRIRENLRKSKRQDLALLINTSVNQTLSRTFLTSGTVLVVTICLFIWGGSVIHDFSFALLVGLVSGTYSTIYVASPILIVFEDWTRGRRKTAAQKSAN